MQTKFFGVVGLLALASLSAQASMINGSFTTDGNGANVTVTAASVTFTPATSNLKVVTSNFTYDNGLPLSVGDIGTILTLPNPFAPVNVPDFMTFTGTTLHFTLTGIGPGDTADVHDCSNATSTGQSCSLLVLGNVSPIVLTWSAGGTNVALHVFGTVTDDLGDTADWLGDLTASLTGPLGPPLIGGPQFSATSHPIDIFNYFTANPGGSITSSNQGSFSATQSSVPEPGSLLLIGGGFIGLATLLRRRRTSK